MGIYGVGKTYGPQLIAEIGDVSRFTHREALTAFAGVDPGVDESGQHKSKSNRASKVACRLRKTLFQIMTTLLQNAPEDDPVYRFLDKKRSQGKPYYVYMTAGANKFSPHLLWQGQRVPAELGAGRVTPVSISPLSKPAVLAA